MRWPITVVVVLALAGSSCTHGYENENRSIVAELPILEHVELVTEEHYGYCSGDTCLLGTDRSGALLTYSVDSAEYTQETLVDAYRVELSGWESSIEAGCANADPSFCDEILIASFTRGQERISFNLDNWPNERFDIHVDARGDA